MNVKYSWFMVFAVLVVILIAGYLLFNTGIIQRKIVTKNTTTTQTNQIKKPYLYDTTIILTGSGFSPATLTIKPETRVIWTNKSGTTGTVNSDNHPTNLLFPFLNLGRFNDGQNMTVIFTKTGKYTYHNELNPDQKGTITVE